jgi:hypothetical protein
MTAHSSNTSVPTVVRTQKHHNSSSKRSAKSVPTNVRDLVLDGADIAAGFFTEEDDFTGPNTATRHGEIEPDGTDVTVTYEAALQFLPTPPFRREWKNVRNAVLKGLDLAALSFAVQDKFTGPHTVIREMDYELEDGTLLPVVWHIKFGRPRLTA